MSMHNLHTGHGKLEYHFKWILLVCDEGTVDFYKWLYERKTGMKIDKSKFGSHISIVRGPEEGIDEGWWRRNLDGPVLEFQYSTSMRWNKTVNSTEYVWLDVESPALEKVRVDLGLTKFPPFGFHLTLGRKRWKSAFY